MISGFLHNGNSKEVIKLFSHMHYKGHKMDEVTFKEKFRHVPTWVH